MDITIDDALDGSMDLKMTRRRMQKIFGGRESMPIDEILRLRGPKVYWREVLEFVLQRKFFSDQQLRSLACDFAEHSLWVVKLWHPEEKRLDEVLQVVRRFLDGQATAGDVDAAKTVACKVKETISRDNAEFSAASAVVAAANLRAPYFEMRHSRVDGGISTSNAKLSVEKAATEAACDAGINAVNAVGWAPKELWMRNAKKITEDEFILAKRHLYTEEIIWQRQRILEELDHDATHAADDA